MQFPKFIFLILILNLLKADGFDTLTYYEKFDVAVQTYKEESYRLSEKYFSSILIQLYFPLMLSSEQTSSLCHLDKRLRVFFSYFFNSP